MVAEIPANLTTSMFVASLLFVVAVWFLIHFYNKSWRVSLPIGIGMAVWYALIFFLGRSGFFGNTLIVIPLIGFGFVILYVFSQLLYRNQYLARSLAAVPIHWLIGVQVFRIMGWGFLSFYALGLIPGEFALPTGWGDVLIGVTALPVAFLYAKKHLKKLAIGWNYVGIADLALSITLGMLTYPRPVQVIPATPDNTLIALFPLVMVPLFAVPLSVLLHLATLRKIRQVSENPL